MTDETERQGELEAEIGRAMRDIYVRAKAEAGYTATYFLQMLAEAGPIATARRLITMATPSDGFTALWERRRLDLTVEAHVVDVRFQCLFSESEVRMARERLLQYGYSGGAP